MICGQSGLKPQKSIQDISDDNLAEYDRDILRLCTWRCISDDMLDGVFRNADKVRSA